MSCVNICFSLPHPLGFDLFYSFFVIALPIGLISYSVSLRTSLFIRVNASYIFSFVTAIFSYDFDILLFSAIVDLNIGALLYFN
jgi:hypothetical protein